MAGLSIGFALTSGCATSKQEPPLGGEARAARIAALERAIEADREALSAMVTRSRDVDLEPLHEDEMLRTVADRLRRETAELRRLQEESAAAVNGATP